MKRILAFLLIILTVAPAFAADERFSKANLLYSEGQYEQAIQGYEEILSTGVESGALYFNLGNAYYKFGELPQAVLNYERALLLKPQDSDIKYNLELAYSQTTDKIETVDPFFLTKWVASIRNKATSDFWTYIGIGCFILMLVFAGFFMYSNSVVFKKAGFYLAIIMLIGTTITLSFAIKQKDKLVNRTHAIVFSPSVTVKSSPDASGTEIFILHEGSKVKIISTLGNWNEIELADGNVGWVESETIKVI